LSAFVGLATADVLQIFHVPAGFVVESAGMYIETADTVQPTGTLNMGDGAQAAGFMVAEAMDGAGLSQTLLTDAYGSTNMESRVYTSADTIDMTCATQALVDARFHVYIMGFLAFNLLGADV
jgi:hypothetical protein